MFPLYTFHIFAELFLSVGTSNFEIRSIKTIHCPFHRQKEDIQKRTSVSPESHSISSFLHAAGQRFVFRTTLHHHHKVPISLRPSDKSRLLHAFPASNPLRCDTLSIRHLLRTPSLIRCSYNFPASKPCSIYCLEH